MKRPMAMACVLVAGLLGGGGGRGVAAGPAGFRPTDGVNAVIGDASWVERHGAAPDARSREEDRIAVHLEHVEAALRATTPRGLDPVQRARRGRLLDALAGYRAARRFPSNDVHPGRRPRFIDPSGALCAVGYLVEQSVGRAAAEAIQRDHEWAYVLDMHDARVASWARDHGFTLEELALIQPTYRFEERRPPPPPRRPAADTVREHLSTLTGEIDRCARNTKGTPRNVSVKLTMRWPPSGEPIVLEAVSTPEHDDFETCVASAARARLPVAWFSTRWADTDTLVVSIVHRVAPAKPRTKPRA